MAMNLQDNLLNRWTLMGVILLIVLVVPSVIAFSLSGFDTRIVIDQFNTYGVLTLVSAGVIILFQSIEYLSKRGKDDKYGNSLLFNAPGEKPSTLGFIKKLSTLQIILGSIFISSLLLFLITVRAQTQLSPLPIIEQQFSPGAGAAFQLFLIPGAENLVLAAVIAATVFGLRRFAVKNDWSPNNFVGMLLLIIPLESGIFGVANHLLRYSGVDTALATVFVFWAIGGLITVFTGTFIPFWILHIINNGVLKFQQFFSSDILQAGVIGLIILTLVLLVYVTAKRRGKK